jgi:hypothetical protein
MKNQNSENKLDEKKDNTYIYAAGVLGLIILAVISLVLKVLGLF